MNEQAHSRKVKPRPLCDITGSSEAEVSACHVITVCLYIMSVHCYLASMGCSKQIKVWKI